MRDYIDTIKEVFMTTREDAVFFSVLFVFIAVGVVVLTIIAVKYFALLKSDKED